MRDETRHDIAICFDPPPDSGLIMKRLADNPRMAFVYRNWEKQDEADRRALRKQAASSLSSLDDAGSAG